MTDGLFDFEDDATADAPAPMTEMQRGMIRDLFATIGVSDARTQFQMVAELTGTRITSVGELRMQSANVLIHRLKSIAAKPDRPLTGNTWADREEPTWIDRL